MNFLVACKLLCYYPREMNSSLQLIGALLAVEIVVFSYFASKFLKLGKEIKQIMATGSQALQDLNQVVTDLTTAVQGGIAEISTLLADIVAANGVNPQQVESSVAQVRALITNINDAVTAAKAATAPPVTAPLSVVVTPSSATLAPGATQAFTAAVSGGAAGGDQSVKWSATNGTIDANGNYTAPASGTDVVTATSNQDGTTTGTASVTVSA